MGLYACSQGGPLTFIPRLSLMINHPQLFNIFIHCINHTQQQPSKSIIFIITLLSYPSNAWAIALIRVILSIGVTSQLTNSKSFNNCIVSKSLGLYVSFLPLMGSWLPAGQQVIQLRIPFLSLLLWTTPDSKCCSSGSQGNRLKNSLINVQKVYGGVLLRTPVRKQRREKIWTGTYL